MMGRRRLTKHHPGPRRQRCKQDESQNDHSVSGSTCASARGTASGSVQSPCREKTCGQRGLWRGQKADTPWVCSCRCCNPTYPCPACPSPSSSPAGRLRAGDRRPGLFTTLNAFKRFFKHISLVLSKMVLSLCRYLTPSSQNK